ncbi:MAG: Uma2 family endonuclease [Bacteroidia bacterium]|nr:Uma2 family endonuclease [Bacteroidia bacterium]
MATPQRKYSAHYTVEEWEHWQDRWELIHGAPYCMIPSPGIEHQYICGNIYHQVKEKLKHCKNCTVHLPIDWQISLDTVVQPDLSVMCEKVGGNRIKIAPTVIFEILSPSTKIKDQTEKFDLYEAEKVKYYVLVDPLTKTYEIYKLLNEKYKKQKSATIFPFELRDCSFDLDFSLIWD